MKTSSLTNNKTTVYHKINCLRKKQYREVELRQTIRSLLKILMLLIVFLPSLAFADIHTMSACSSAAWDTAYAAASAGDTIAFPDGTCAVTMTKSIAKQNLTILGKGTSSGTTITGGFT